MLPADRQARRGWEQRDRGWLKGIAGTASDLQHPTSNPTHGCNSCSSLMALGSEGGYPCLSHTSSHKVTAKPASWGLTDGVADQPDRPHLAPRACFKAQRVLLKTNTSDSCTSSASSNGLSSSLMGKIPYLRSWGCFRPNFDHHLLPEACSFCWSLLPIQVNFQALRGQCRTLQQLAESRHSTKVCAPWQLQAYFAATTCWNQAVCSS